MKFKLLLLAVTIIACAETGCRDVEKEQRQLALDSLTVIRRIADSVQQITAIEGAHFGCNEQEAIAAIDKFNSSHNYSVKDLEYDHIDPYYFKNGLMELKIVGKDHKWSERKAVDETLKSCIDLFLDEYGDAVEIDSTIKPGIPHDEAMILRWAKGDKNISIRIISDKLRFAYEIDIWSDKMMKAYTNSIVDGMTNPL